MREAAAAAPGAEGDDQACSSESTSPGSGNRCSLCFEKTTSPSRTMSNCPFVPLVAVASMPLAFSSAARLAARSSYPPQVGQ
jgi:hypothetical protein